MSEIRMHYSLESHMAAEQVVLPCGCRINETTVLAMCWTHANVIREQRVKRDQFYAEFRRLMDEAVVALGNRAGNRK